MTGRSDSRRLDWRKISVGIPLIYAGIGVLWILLSDRILLFLVRDVERLTRLQILKGWFYVAVTALLLFHLLRREVKKLEKSHSALAESEAKFKAIFHQTFQFLGLLDPEGKLIATNDTALAFAGLTEDQTRGLPFWKTLWWSHSDEVQAQLERAVRRAAEGHFVRFETTNVGKNGEIIDVDFSLKPVFDSDGRVLFLIPEGRDITEKKKADRELAEYRSHLEELVEVRTSDLKKAQEELLAKEKLAALGQLTSTVSHELRNPLGSIQNAIYTLEHSIEGKQRTDQIERSFQFAERNIRRCVMVIDQLLDFASDKTLYFEETDMDSFLSDWFEIWPKPNEILLATRFQSNARMRIDRQRFGQALEKILSNSVESFQEKDPGPHEIGVHAYQKEGAIEIKITDTGPGIPQPILDKVHEPLFSTKGFGVGLGIPFAEDIVKKHLGEVRIESEEQVGTTVRIRLPLHQQ